mgnify:CR=1 FL=1
MAKGKPLAPLRHDVGTYVKSCRSDQDDGPSSCVPWVSLGCVRHCCRVARFRFSFIVTHSSRRPSNVLSLRPRTHPPGDRLHVPEGVPHPQQHAT